MRNSPLQSRRWGVVARSLLLCVAGCALGGCASVRDPYRGERPADPKDYTPAVPDMAQAKEGAQQEWIDVAGKDPIPVRHYPGSPGQTPVVLLHGLQSHSLWFVQSARHLADLGLPVYAMDRRGSGLSRSRRGDAEDYREMVDDIDVVVEHARQRHGSEKVHLVGHCFGAIPATLYACMYQDKVKSIVLPTPGIHTHSDLSGRQKVNVFWYTIGDRTRYIPVPLELEAFTDEQAYRDFIAEDALSLKYATVSMYYAIHKARQYLLKHAETIQVPVFMGFAGADRISDSEGNTAFFERLGNPRNELKTYEQARHILEYSGERDAFFEDLEDWYRKLGELK